MRHRISIAALAITALVLSFAAAPAAWAADLDSAKAAGQVGERADGYLGLVNPGAPPAVKQLVDEVNAKRKAKYAEIAKQNGTSVAAVAALAGPKLIERTAAGQYVMGTDGRWVKK
jgi:uncharacterized protein YdbL (DUF1318 family)